MADEKISDVLAVESGSDAPRRQKAEHMFGHRIDSDEALKLLNSDNEPIVVDAATDRRLMRKIDMMLMPMFFTIYGIQFLDKTTLSYASVTGIQKDIHLQGDNYQWLGSLFYFGYLGFEYPAVYLLQRLPLAKYSAACIIAWGTVLSCFAAVENFGGAVVIRLLLGVCEASVSPAWTLFTSQWYKKDEQDLRTSIWFSANGFAQIFGGLVAYGIANGSTIHHFSISPWKIIFLLTGILTIVLGFIFLAIIPDSQLNAWWLRPEDRRLAVERVRGNQQGIGNKTWKSYQLREALTDPITWAFFISGVAASIPNGGITNFFSLLIESFGYNAEQSLLYGCISGAMEVVGIFGWVYLGRLLKSRLLSGVVALVIALIGSIILIALPPSESKGRLAGFYLTQLWPGASVAIFSLLSTNVAGYTKKTTVAGIYFIGYCAGNIIGPQTFRPNEEPNYTSAKITIIVCWFIFLIDELFIFFWYIRENKKKALRRNAPDYEKLKNQEFLDLTDRENPEFVYVL